MIADRITRRKRRISRKIFGTKDRPRISIHRSHKYIYAQAIDDEAKKTITSYASVQLSQKGKQTKSEQAKQVGVELGERLKKAKIRSAVYDRGQYAYNGRVKMLAEGLRESDLII